MSHSTAGLKATISLSEGPPRELAAATAPWTGGGRPPERPEKMIVTRTERFQTKFDVDKSGCWLWSGAKIPEGYGQFWNGTKVVRAHRWSYEHYREKIPSHLELDHLCRISSCVNPDHLEAVTHQENILRGDAPAAKQARRSHCIYGHPLSGTNVYNTRAGRRQCKVCIRRVQRESYWRMKA